ncbi:MAG TPA: hypothetical protein VJ903_00780 [Clostridia bacterium]|nr:hypothetical protein [Clostridia bacterium]
MEKRNNRIINEIMSNSTSSIIVLSSSDCEHTSYLSELSNRYKVTYWYNAKYDNHFAFSLELARKVLSNDYDTYYKMLQLKYCENDKVDNIILKVVLEDIKKRQGDCLFVFDHMEELPDSFDFTMMELLIRECPKNLKLIFISEKLININYNTLEELAPKIIDDFALGSSLNVDSIDLDSKEITDNDIHFLSYISQIEEVPIGMAESIYFKASDVLHYVSIKYKNLVMNKNNARFTMSRTFHKIVSEKSNLLGESPFVKDIMLVLYEYMNTNGKYINGLSLGLRCDNLDFIRNSLLKIANDWGIICHLLEMAKIKENTISEKYISIEYPECLAYAALCDGVQGRSLEAIKKLDAIIECENTSLIVWQRCCYYKAKILTEIGEFTKGVEFINSVMQSKNSKNKAFNLDCIMCYLPQLLHHLEQNIEYEKLKNCENHIMKTNYTDSVLYIKMLQSMSEAFFDLGNCKKAIALVTKIKSIIPFYVVPHRLLQYFYYMNDPHYAEKVALNALKKAKENYITKDIASIYCLLTKIYSFWNMKEEAMKNIELAIKCEDSCDFIKYYSIALRVICYARFSKKEFVKDIAIIYGKQCEQTNSFYGLILFSSVSYWYWYNHRKEEALFYANKCIKSNARNGMWFMASAVAINYALEDETNQDMKKIVSKLFYTAEQYAMDVVIIDHTNLFANIIKFACDHNLNTPYLDKINKLIINKKQREGNVKKIKVQAMGGVSVLVNDGEIQWKTKKARELFMIYVVRGEQGIDRANIFSLLWGEYIYESAINNLKTTNNIIRKTLSEHNIDHKLLYKNGKYILTLANCEFDYVKYLNYVERMKAETVLSEKIGLMLDIMDIYKNGFAPELGNAEFKEIAQRLKQNISLMLVEFIKLLIDNGRLIDANKFQNFLEKIDDQGKYKNMILKLE